MCELLFCVTRCLVLVYVNSKTYSGGNFFTMKIVRVETNPSLLQQWKDTQLTSWVVAIPSPIEVVEHPTQISEVIPNSNHFEVVKHSIQLFEAVPSPSLFHEQVCTLVVVMHSIPSYHHTRPQRSRQTYNTEIAFVLLNARVLYFRIKKFQKNVLTYQQFKHFGAAA